MKYNNIIKLVLNDCEHLEQLLQVYDDKSK